MGKGSGKNRHHSAPETAWGAGATALSLPPLLSELKQAMLSVCKCETTSRLPSSRREAFSAWARIQPLRTLCAVQGRGLQTHKLAQLQASAHRVPAWGGNSGQTLRAAHNCGPWV